MVLYQGGTLKATNGGQNKIPKLAFRSPLVALKFGFDLVLHLQSTVYLVVQYISHGDLHHHFGNENRDNRNITYLPYTVTRHVYLSLLDGNEEPLTLQAGPFSISSQSTS